MRLLVKIGGAALEENSGRRELVRAIAAARTAGHEVIVVHGGGQQIGTWSERVGLEASFQDGLRVTDAAQSEVVLAVLAGLVNRTLVQALAAGGQAACGLTGADAGLFDAAELAPGSGLGYVGTIATVRPAIVETLLAAGTIPVIATVAPRPGKAAEPFFNINADMAAATLAKELAADTLLFLTDVAGVLDDAGAVYPTLDEPTCRALFEAGRLRGGMQPKIEAALDAATSVNVKIAPAGGSNAVLDALFSEIGTAITTTVVGQGGGAHG